MKLKEIELLCSSFDQFVTHDGQPAIQRVLDVERFDELKQEWLDFIEEDEKLKKDE